MGLYLYIRRVIILDFIFNINSVMWFFRSGLLVFCIFGRSIIRVSIFSVVRIRSNGSSGFLLFYSSPRIAFFLIM